MDEGAEDTHGPEKIGDSEIHKMPHTKIQNVNHWLRLK